jgi:cell division protein FtsI (penicillin-binding protein 3)
MSEPELRTWQKTVRDRVLIAAILFAVWALAIQARLVWLQVFQHDAMLSEAASQKNREFTLDPRRGDIVDRRGRTLAISVDAVSISAIPSRVECPEDLADAVCWGLGNCTAQERDRFVQRLSEKERDFAYLRRQPTIEESDRVAALELPGIYMRPEVRRYYPNRELAAHVLGYLGIEYNRGLAGIEQSYNSEISGQPGKILVEIDRRGLAFSRVERPPVQGDTIELTIDANLQHIAERELEAGVAENRAAGGSVIIMDPRTGEILAMANSPSFNPNAYGEYPGEQRMNAAVQGIYEPGSTFKLFTASAAMEEHVFSPADPIDASGGVWRNGSRIVREANGHDYGVLSFTDVLVKSSNVGAIKIGLGVGRERLGRYVHRFGFGERLSVGLPGETPGMLADPGTWSQSTLVSVSMGYEIGVTPLQMATAVSSVANGGVLVQPRIVRALRHGDTRTEFTPLDLRRSINRETAAELVTIMEQVVDHGTATAAKIHGYTVAGKTGTASKIVGRRYSTTDYHSSFVGFVPSRQPAFTILVVIDSPHAGKIYGGAVAAPIFQRIGEAALRYADVAPTLNPAPPVLVRASADESAPAELIHTATSASAPQVDVVTGPPTVPDVRGLGLREAARRLVRLGLVARPTGDGIVIDQDPAAGTPLAPGRACRLWLERVGLPLPPSPPNQ